MRTRQFAIVAAFLATLIAGSSFAILRSNSGEKQPITPPKRVESESSTPALSLVIPSPTGSGTIMSASCRESKNPHEPSSCNARLVNEDGADAGWEVENVVFGAWSRDGSSVALEDAEHRVTVARLDESPTTIPGFYVTPSLSPNGTKLIAVELGPEGDALTRIGTSPGIILIDLKTGNGEIVLTDDVYMPFFIDENRIGYGSGGDDQIASLYMFDLRTEKSVKMTNRDADPQTLDPMPIAPPIATDNGTLLFTTFGKGGEKVFELALDDFTLTARPELSAPSIADHQVVPN